MKKSKQSTKKHKKTNLWNKFRAMKWYVKIPLVLTVIIVLFLLAKLCVTAYYRHQFDSAEAKMMKLDLPKASTTTYNHSCSYKSTLKLSKGFPNCGVLRADISEIESKDIAVNYAYNFYKNIEHNASASFQNKQELSDMISSKSEYLSPSISLHNFQQGLSCYATINYQKGDQLLRSGWQDLKSESSYLVTAISCYKRTFVQLYPER